jgi:hypothetical protein
VNEPTYLATSSMESSQTNLLRTLVQHTAGSIEIDNTALQGHASRIVGLISEQFVGNGCNILEEWDSVSNSIFWSMEPEARIGGGISYKTGIDCCQRNLIYYKRGFQA